MSFVGRNNCRQSERVVDAEQEGDGGREVAAGREGLSSLKKKLAAVVEGDFCV
jgi:hypothetical protein